MSQLLRVTRNCSCGQSYETDAVREDGVELVRSPFCPDCTQSNEGEIKCGVLERAGISSLERKCLDCGETFIAKAFVVPSGSTLRGGSIIVPASRLCEKCIGRAEEREQREAQEATTTQQAAELLAERALLSEKLNLIPMRFRGLKIDNDDVGRWVKRYLAGDRRSLVIAGDYGVGKSGNAWAAWAEIAKANPHRTFQGWSIPNLLAQIRSEGWDGYRTLQAAQHADVLLLDELGLARGTEWVMQQLYIIVNDRYENDRPIIATTNGNLQKLAEAVGPALTSRLTEMAYFVDWTGPDRRRKK